MESGAHAPLPVPWVPVQSVTRDVLVWMEGRDMRGWDFEVVVRVTEYHEGSEGA